MPGKSEKKGKEEGLFTVGHGTVDRQQLADLLHEAGIKRIVDVRTAPGSRRNPDVGRERLAKWLPEEGIEYRWEPRLGGFRKTPPDSPDAIWRNDSFRGYAGYTREPEFVAAMDELLEELGDGVRTAIMCSETVWWRCHRRIIADFATLARGTKVRHLMHDGRFQEHVPTEGVRLRDDGLLVYDGKPTGPDGGRSGS